MHFKHIQFINRRYWNAVVLVRRADSNEINIETDDGISDTYHGNNNDIHNYNGIIPRDVTQSKHISQIPAPSVAGALALELPEPSAWRLMKYVTGAIVIISNTWFRVRATGEIAERVLPCASDARASKRPSMSSLWKFSSARGHPLWCPPSG